jgi:tetratricopeptide (TPR) repeat protein
VVQRAESLVGLWLLLTLYAAARALDSARPATWRAAALAACALGMGTKEVMCAAPLLVWLHDGLCFAPGLRAAWRGRRGFYLGLAATWLLLAWLVWRTGDRGATAGFGLGISPWHYLLTQCGALLHYVRLAGWPAPLILDYGFGVVTDPLAAALPGLLLLAGFAATVRGLARGQPWAFLGSWFFLLLGPSSSVVPVATQTIAEHRMYLPLAALVATAVLALVRVGGPRFVWPLAAIALAGAVLVRDRNTDYRSALAIWHDTAAKRPDNARAHQELGVALKAAGQPRAALPSFERALALVPHYDKGRHNYATTLTEVGELAAAARQFELILARDPGFADSHYGLGNVRRMQGDPAAAVAAFESAARLRPGFAAAHNNAALLLFEAGRHDAALAHFAAAVRGDPGFLFGYVNWANALFRLDRPAEAVPLYEAAVRLAPGALDARENLGVALSAAGRVAEGIRVLEETLRLAPDRASVQRNLAAARARLAAP